MTRAHHHHTMPAGDRIRDLRHAAALLKDAHELLCGAAHPLAPREAQMESLRRLVLSAHARVSTVAGHLESDVERGFVTP